MGKKKDKIIELESALRWWKHGYNEIQVSYKNLAAKKDEAERASARTFRALEFVLKRGMSEHSAVGLLAELKAAIDDKHGPFDSDFVTDILDKHLGKQK